MRSLFVVLLSFFVVLPASAELSPGNARWIPALARAGQQACDAALVQYRKAVTPSLKRLFTLSSDEKEMSIWVVLVFSGEQFEKQVLGGWESSGMVLSDKRAIDHGKTQSGETETTTYELKITGKKQSLRSVVNNNRIYWAGTIGQYPRITAGEWRKNVTN